MSENSYASKALADAYAATVHTNRLTEMALYGYTVSGSEITAKNLATGLDVPSAPKSLAWDSNPRNVSTTYYVSKQPVLNLDFRPTVLTTPTKFTITQDSSDGTITVSKLVHPYTGDPVISTFSKTQKVDIYLDDGTGDTSSSDTIRLFGEDAIIILPRNKILECASIMTWGGRNVNFIGGHIKGTIPANASVRQLYYPYNLKGCVYVEGVLFDMDRQYGMDGFDPGGNVSAVPLRKADVYLQKCRSINADSTSVGYHSDAFQYYGSTRNTYIRDFSFTTRYQGMFLDPQNDCALIDIDRCNGNYIDPSDSTSRGALLFLRDVPNNARKPVVNLGSNVYMGNRDNCTDWATPNILASGVLTGNTGDTVFHDTTQNFVPNSLVGKVLRAMTVPGAFYKKVIISNTATSITTSAWPSYGLPIAGVSYIVHEDDSSVIRPNTVDRDFYGVNWGATLAGDKQSVTFAGAAYGPGGSPYMPWTGGVKRGQPPGGDFCKPSDCGLYYMPAYLRP